MRLLVKGSACVFFLSSLLGCYESSESGDFGDMGADSRVVLDSSVVDMDGPPDYGPNCVAIMTASGTWEPSCLEPDLMLEMDMSAEVGISLVIHSPLSDSAFSQGQVVGFSATIMSVDLPLEFVALELVSSLDGTLPLTFDRATGRVGSDLVSLTPGSQTLTLTARAAPDLEVSASVDIMVDCTFRTDFSEPLDEEVWSQRGSATLVEPGGWLEMTNNVVNRQGGIFLIGKSINPGDLDISFQISAGASGCPLPERDCVNAQGEPRELADGFALSFWNVNPGQLDQLWELLGQSGNGAMYSEATLARVGIEPGNGPEGFTVEFDLYYNYCPNNGFYDPTRLPHIEIQQNGSFARGGCELMDFAEEEGLSWAPFPQLSDNYWHDINVRIIGQQVTVLVDGVTALDTTLPEFRFKGGILAFSGGSGAVAAYQRFDNLVINSTCN